MRRADESAPNQYIVQLEPGSDPRLIDHVLRRCSHETMQLKNHYLVRCLAEPSDQLLNQLANDPAVVSIEPQLLFKGGFLSDPNDTNYSSQYHLPMIHAPQAWSIWPGSYQTAASVGNGATRTRIMHMDSGLDCNHADFMNAGGSSTDVLQGGQIDFALGFAFQNTTVGSPCATWQDDFGHGTTTGGILAAATNNTLYTAGAGYPLVLVEYKIFNSAGSGNTTDISNALIRGTNAGVRVGSASIVGPYAQTWNNSARYAWQHDVLAVICGGNSGGTTDNTFADINFAMPVGYVDSGNNWSGANAGNAIAISAPGIGIVTIANGGGITTQFGCSEATPQVAAAAAMLVGQHPSVPIAAVVQRIEQTASSPGGWNNQKGYGLLDMSAAFSASLRSSTTGGLRGQIINTAGNAQSNAVVLIDGSLAALATQSATFRATLSPGVHTVQATLAPFTTKNQDFYVAPGSDTVFEIDMQQTYFHVTGKVSRLGVGVAYAIVQSIGGGLITATATAAADGTYSLWVPSTGSFNVRAATMDLGNISSGSLTSDAVVNLSYTPTPSSKGLTVLP